MIALVALLIAATLCYANRRFWWAQQTHRWFAWHPVSDYDTGTWIWLRPVMRYKAPLSSWYYHALPPKSKLGTPPQVYFGYVAVMLFLVIQLSLVL
jgi:hypothetical protein